MKDSNHIVIGMGEIGKPIYNILSEFYYVDRFDATEGSILNPDLKYDVIHICFGHKENEKEDFISWVKEYQQKFLKEGGLTIIHSTVAVGVTKELDAVHSPIRGQHHSMEKSVRTFVKFFGGARASEASEYFRRIGIKVLITERSYETEAMKLFDTEYYRVCVEFAKRVAEYCEAHSLNYSTVYRLANITYNEGYQKLGFPEYTRPVLEPIQGEIGGHCLVPNSKLIKLSES